MSKPSQAASRLGVIGAHPERSLSPAGWNEYFARIGSGWRYSPLPATPASLPAVVELVRGRDWLGANVTMPHKAAVLDLVDAADADASEVGAASWIAKAPDGTLVAHNTDVAAARSLLRDRYFTRTLLIGAGGVAAAVARALCGRTETLEMIDINPDAAKRLAALTERWNLATEIRASPAEAAPKCDLVVNASPVGMSQDDDTSPLPIESLATGAVVYDLVYRPSGPTPLHRDALAAGHTVIAGISHLIEQAVAMLPSLGCDPATAPALRSSFTSAARQAQDRSSQTPPSPA